MLSDGQLGDTGGAQVLCGALDAVGACRPLKFHLGTMQCIVHVTAGTL